MARGKKTLTPEELLEQVLQSIEDTEASLKALKNQKKDLEKQIEEKELAELHALLKERNLTVQDVKDKLGDE